MTHGQTRSLEAAAVGVVLAREAAALSLITRLNHHAVKSGVRTAVTITDAATCTVAAPAIGANEVSAKATA